MRSITLVLATLFISSLVAATMPQPTSRAVIGHVDATSARIWVHAPDETTPRLVFEKPADGDPPRVEMSHAGDGSYHAHVTRLRPRTQYAYEIKSTSAASGVSGTFTTAPSRPGQRTRIAFISCINDRRFKRQPALATIAKRKPDALVLLGDTPYIDTTDLARQRSRYRTFWALPDAGPLFPRIPTWATWDDHDFGKNDTDGNLPGKENARRAFVEHHAHASYGNGREGIYTSFRWGPVEVFILDARWWANTGPSPIDPKKKTLLGKDQWDWVRRGLRESQAPFKVLATGMIWNGAVRPLKRDHWLTWRHERDALFSFIGKQEIPGVVLVGGDIHRSRALKHATSDRAGYPLYEFIASPTANTIIEAANVKHPGLLHDAAERHAFMLMDVTASRMTVHCINHEDREVFSVTIDGAELR